MLFTQLARLSTEHSRHSGHRGHSRHIGHSIDITLLRLPFALLSRYNFYLPSTDRDSLPLGGRGRIKIVDHITGM